MENKRKSEQNIPQHHRHTLTHTHTHVHTLTRTHTHMYLLNIVGHSSGHKKENVRTLTFYLKPSEKDPTPRRVKISIGTYCTCHTVLYSVLSSFISSHSLTLSSPFLSHFTTPLSFTHYSPTLLPLSSHLSSLSTLLSPLSFPIYPLSSLPSLISPPLIPLTCIRIKTKSRIKYYRCSRNSWRYRTCEHVQPWRQNRTFIRTYYKK